MSDGVGRLAWIAIAPVKSMALVFLDRAHLGAAGIRGDRAFALIDATGRLVNGKRMGTLATVIVEHDPSSGTLTMRLPDGRVVDGRVVIGDALEALFFGEQRPARAVVGPWDAALSNWSGRDLRLVAMDRGEGPDRGPSATLLTVASLADLAVAGGADEPLDRRRFRMTFGIDGVPAHAEDGWLGRDVRIGPAVVRIAGNVGRCAVTTHDPDTGQPSFDTLRVLNAQRGHLPSSEPLPFGVWAEVIAEGDVALGDPIEPISAEPHPLDAADPESA